MHLGNRFLNHIRLTLVAVLAVMVLTITIQAQADQPLPFSAHYKAKYRGISIKATRSLKILDDGSQLFAFSADSFIANLKESSHFNWDGDDFIVPQSYTYARGGLGRDRKAELTFDWSTNKVINDVQRKPWQMDVPAKALDKLSYQLQLRADLLNGKTLAPYQIADGGKLKEYGFEILGEETLATRAGKFQVIKVKRLRKQDDKRQTVIWFAKDWNYLVVRLQQEENDKSYEIDLASATLDGREVKGEE